MPRHTTRRAPAAADGMPLQPFFNTPAQRTALARQRFFEDGERPTGLVSETVIQSWLHCMQLGRQPQQAPSLDPVTRSQRNAALARNHALLEAAGPELDHVDDTLAGTPVKALLADRHGVIVRATPVGPGDGRLLHSSCHVGRDLGEALVGTTAPAITARTGTACTVFGGEHFLDDVMVMHCAAAPIRNAHGELAGVLDLSIEGRPFPFDAASLVRITARAIENRLLSQTRDRQWLLHFQSHPTLLGTPLEGLSAVCEDGSVAWLNAAGRSLLVPPRASQPDGAWSVESLFGCTLSQLLDHGGAPVRVSVPSGLRLWLRIDEPARRPHAARVVAAAPADEPRVATHDDPASSSLKDASRQLIETALSQHGGNIAKTARALGVSRGLLYRRLKGNG